MAFHSGRVAERKVFLRTSQQIIFKNLCAIKVWRPGRHFLQYLSRQLAQIFNCDKFNFFEPKNFPAQQDLCTYVLRLYFHANGKLILILFRSSVKCVVSCYSGTETNINAKTVLSEAQGPHSASKLPEPKDVLLRCLGLHIHIIVLQHTSEENKNAGQTRNMEKFKNPTDRDCKWL